MRRGQPFHDELMDLAYAVIRQWHRDIHRPPRPRVEEVVRWEARTGRSLTARQVRELIAAEARSQAEREELIEFWAGAVGVSADFLQEVLLNGSSRF